MDTPHQDPEPEAPSQGEPHGARGGEEVRGGEGAGGSGEEARGAQSAEPRGIPLGALPARDLLMWFLGLLAAKAWEGMGLVPDAAAGRIQQNLDDARIAIDAYAAVLDAMRARLDSAQRREVETVLTNLRLNFVEKSAGRARGEGTQAP